MLLTNFLSLKVNDASIYVFSFSLLAFLWFTKYGIHGINMLYKPVLFDYWFFLLHCLPQMCICIIYLFLTQWLRISFSSRFCGTCGMILFNLSESWLHGLLCLVKKSINLFLHQCSVAVVCVYLFSNTFTVWIIAHRVKIQLTRFSQSNFQISNITQDFLHLVVFLVSTFWGDDNSVTDYQLKSWPWKSLLIP